MEAPGFIPAKCHFTDLVDTLIAADSSTCPGENQILRSFADKAEDFKNSQYAGIASSLKSICAKYQLWR
jgi:hypothetical protein